jgi:hypothetical protein
MKKQKKLVYKRTTCFDFNIKPFAAVAASLVRRLPVLSSSSFCAA